MPLAQSKFSVCGDQQPGSEAGFALDGGFSRKATPPVLAIINRKSEIDNLVLFSGVEIRLSQEFSSSCPTRHPG
jgi:hypothetical protein